MIMISRYILILLITVGGFTSLSGQTQRDTITETNQPTKKNSFTSIFYGEPGKAALYSLIIPGAGQLYNKRWWKVPLIWAGEGFLLYNLLDKQSNFSTLDNCWKSLVEPDNFICNTNNLTESQLAAQSNTTESFTFRNSARSQRDQAWIFLIAGHLINVLEAFVDRHLINFDTSDDLSFRPVYMQYPEAIVSQNSTEITTTTLFSIHIPLSR